SRSSKTGSECHAGSRNSSTHVSLGRRLRSRVAKRSTFGRQRGGSWKSQGPRFRPRPATRSRNRATGSSGSLSFFLWVRKRLTLTAKTKSRGVEVFHALKTARDGSR